MPVGKRDKQKAKRGLRVLMAYALKYKNTIIVIIFLNLISSLLSGATPYISGKLFDSISSTEIVKIMSFGSVPLWVFILTIWILTQLVGRLVDWQNSKKQNFFSLDITNIYNLNGVKKLISLPLAFHKNHKKGNTIDRINSAGGRLNSAIGILFDFLPEILTIAVGLFFVFWINYVFGIIMVVANTVFVLAMARTAKIQKKYRKEGMKAGSRTFGNLYDAVGNIKSVKQAGSEDYEYKRFYNGLINGSQFFWKKVIGINIGLDLLQRSIILISQIFVFIFSIISIRNGSMTLGQLFAVNGYLAMSFGPIATFVRWYNYLTDCFISIERAEKILGEKSEKYESSDFVQKESFDGNIRFDNVHFRYMDTKGQKTNSVLDGVSFDVKKGETVAIVGESGVGKTTIADLISGFYFPQKGHIFIDGVETSRLPLEDLRRSIAVVSQDITIFNETIRYNMKYGIKNVSDSMIIKASKEANAHEFISKFKSKYSQKVGERGVKLSGGQRQRVAIAQAILKKSPILILDEPTSALDARTEKMVTESLEKLMKGRTTIIIAHRLSTVRKADKIIVMDKGKVVEIGKHKDLIKKKSGVYRKFYEVQKL